MRGGFIARVGNKKAPLPLDRRTLRAMTVWAAVRAVLNSCTGSGIPGSHRRRQDPPQRPSDVPQLLPVRGLSELFPGIERAEVRFPISRLERQGEWALPLAELLTVAAICRYTQPRRIYEMGTYTGATTLGMVLNAPDDAEVYTLDLDPTERAAIGTTVDGADASAIAVGACFRDTPIAYRVHQLFGNTLTFDHSPYFGTIDLVLIDANHTYPYVRSDSETAFRLLRPGGTIIWDDYTWEQEHPECAGVAQCLNELVPIHRLFHIRGTRLAIYLDSGGGQTDPPSSPAEVPETRRGQDSRRVDR